VAPILDYITSRIHNIQGYYQLAQKIMLSKSFMIPEAQIYGLIQKDVKMKDVWTINNMTQMLPLLIII